jgi:hypothetical protein
LGEMGLSGFGVSCKISDFRLPLEQISSIFFSRSMRQATRQGEPSEGL